ncbi:hypothetical protein K7X08_020873 [Anisodus acutangulus]|uniref:MATH domain-containing protein n=1 Tax=Anisodus acutangulus TaxID=402998 RepID=A0A9Q1MU18_9SOLA|nr:hypothetical protein K7X08_020873 [Anisodus acutangulus]
MKLIRSVLWAANAFKLRSSDHPQAFRTFSTLPNFGIQGKTKSKIYSNQHSILGMNVCSTCNVGRRCFIHYGSPKEAEMGNNSRPMDFVRGLMEDNTRGVLSGAPLSGYHIEQDADIVHTKVLRNNAFVTVTDSKGNKKFGATAGKLTGKGGKVARYAAESIAEHIGREARDRGLSFLVCFCDGFTDIGRTLRDIPPAHYTLKVGSFSFLVQLLEKSGRKRYESEIFEASGHKWKLCLYPNGNEERGGKGHISLCLAITNTDGLPRGWEVNVSFKFLVFDQIRDNSRLMRSQDAIMQ